MVKMLISKTNKTLNKRKRKEDKKPLSNSPAFLARFSHQDQYFMQEDKSFCKFCRKASSFSFMKIGSNGPISIANCHSSVRNSGSMD